MNNAHVLEISPGIYHVGVRDWNRRIFDSLIPLPQGTTYNAYVVKGSEKTALVDTVNPGFEEELTRKVEQVSDPAELDYLVMNHAEPDHAGAIPHVMKWNDRVTLITSEKGAKMARLYFEVPEDRIRKVKDGDSIDLGGKTLKFIDAPMLHWPETMFTYVPEDKVLFPCDFLGFHTAFGVYDDDIEEFEPFAKRYYGEIMMPFSKMGQRALEKLKPLDIKFICPSHGPIHRNPKRILDLYRQWTAGETKEKVIVVYTSMWGSTERMVKAMVDTLLSEGVEICLHNLANADIGDVARDLVDSRGIVLGAPTVLLGLHPAALYGTLLTKALKPPLKYAAVLSSYGWSGGAVKQAGEILGDTSIEVVGAVDINGPPKDEDMEKVIELGKEMARRIKA